LYIAGGPGGATGLDAQNMPGWFDWMEQVDWSSDVILYDQRGVGLSEPALGCPETTQRRRELLDSELPVEQQYVLMRDAMHACRDRLLDEGWDLGQFNTRHNADDALALVRALGLKEWQMYGVSYGTRVALELMRRQPAGLRSVVLDSAYPPQVQAEASDTWLLSRAMYLFIRSCELLSECDFHPERLRADLENAMAYLRERPMRLELRDPDSGLPLPVVFDADDLAWLIFESQYAWNNLHLLPGAVSSLARGNISSEMRGMLQESVDLMLDDSLSEAVANSVDCADNGAFSRAAFVRQLRRYPFVASIRQYDWDFGACRSWPSGDAGEHFRQAVLSDVPTLVLAGEFDPVTPPQWGYQAAQGLSRANVFTFPGIGHGVLDSDSCAVELVRAFLDNPNSPQAPACLGLFQ
jgi:pimeloyl-ACP methyl ester carboxylesterase